MKEESYEMPYFSGEMIFRFVSIENKFMKSAMLFARENSLDKIMPIGSVLVKDNNIIGLGANGSDYHNKNICKRISLNIATGQGYDLCEGCHYKNHSEQRAISDAIIKGFNIRGSDLYLWGHWWCCRWCRNLIISSNIKNIYLLEKSEILFNKNKKGNIVGKQFLI